ENDKYVSVKPNEQGHYPIPELDLELALVDGWIRFWHQGQLLPLPDQLKEALDEAIQRAKQAEKRADEATKRADDLQARVESNEQTIRSLQEELARLRAKDGKRGAG